jgi:hypothetical protein
MAVAVGGGNGVEFTPKLFFRLKKILLFRCSRGKDEVQVNVHYKK